MSQSVTSKFYTIRYAVYGAVIGIFFPVFATILGILEHHLTFSLQGIIEAQVLGAPFSSFIYTVPVFLGVIASIAGRYRDELAAEVYFRAQSEERLKLQMDDLEVMVVTRTEELRHVQKQIIDSTHRAELTEIATKVLHFKN